MLWPSEPASNVLLTDHFIGRSNAVNIDLSCVLLFQTEPNLYVASLAVTDLLMGGAVLPVALFYVLRGEWGFGSGLCEVRRMI